MEKDRPIEEMIQRFDLYSDFAKKEAENKVLKEEITRLKMALEEAKRQAGGFHSDILMASVVDALLHQAKSLSTFIFEHEGDNRPSES